MSLIQENLFDIVLLEEDLFDVFWKDGGKSSKKIGVIIYVSDMSTLERAAGYTSKASYVVVHFKDETKIPLELVLAESQHYDVQIVTRVGDGLETEIVFGVLEMGSHGVLFNNPNIDKVISVGTAIADTAAKLYQELSTLVVTKIAHIGMGERVCIDTCTYLGLDEGILIGSFSRGGILVCSETHPLPYMPLRPFRVNAGSLHSYAMAPNNRTWYLSDLQSGMELLAVKTDGTARKVPVGRIKIEKRPLIQVTVKPVDDSSSKDPEEFNIILQEDWHVRIFGKNGKPKNVTTLKPGEELLGYTLNPGRHVGISVDEWILER